MLSSRHKLRILGATLKHTQSNWISTALNDHTVSLKKKNKEKKRKNKNKKKPLVSEDFWGEMEKKEDRRQVREAEIQLQIWDSEIDM